MPGISIRPPAIHAAKPSLVTPLNVPSASSPNQHSTLNPRQADRVSTKAVRHRGASSLGVHRTVALFQVTLLRDLRSTTSKYKLKELEKSGDDFGTWGPRIAATPFFAYGDNR